MAGSPSNFDAEIKKSMQPKNANSSTNATPGKAPSKASGTFNRGTNSAPPVVPSAMTDTHQAMIDAGQAHMAAIHAHINSMKGG